MTGTKALPNSLGMIESGLYQLSMSAWEMHNELIFDLVEPRNKNLDLLSERGQPTQILGLTSKQITSVDGGIKLVAKALESRDNSSTTFGRVKDRSSCGIVFTLLRKVNDWDEYPIQSTFTILIPAGAECLADDNVAVRIKEGPRLNKAVTTLDKVVETLAGGPSMITETPFNDSLITKLCTDIVGGNCETRLLVTLVHNETPALPRVLQFSKNFAKITNFPVLGDGAARGLETRYRRLLQNVQLITATDDGKVTARGRIDDGADMHRYNELEGKVVHGNLELLKLKEENDRLGVALSKVRSHSQCTCRAWVLVYVCSIRVP